MFPLRHCWLALGSADWEPEPVLFDVVVAHQGGWDEMLFVALPIGLFAFLLYVANKRAQAELDASEREDEPSDDH